MLGSSRCLMRCNDGPADLLDAHTQDVVSDHGASMREHSGRLLESEVAVEPPHEAKCVSPSDLDEALLQHLQRGDVFLLRPQEVIDSVVATSYSNSSERGANALS